MTDFETGSILDGRYEILHLLGSGGMGRVYKARQLNLDRIVAIKVPSDAVLENEEFLARFVREGRTCARVAHGHIVAIYDVRSGKRPYIVMEYVDGMPLNQFLIEQQTTLFVSDLLEIIGQVCQGLDAAHANGIVHRDIKPANIVITHDNQRVKVMDFGIARVSDNTSITTAGSMMGTPFYMAPEQIRGENVGPPTDLYALGCVVYYLFTGKLVFEGEVATLIYKHISAAPVPPRERNPMLPKAADAVILRALQKAPAERYASTLEFHRELCKAMRSIAHLPYSQIFTQPESPVIESPPPRRPTGPSIASQRTLTSPPKTTSTPVPQIPLAPPPPEPEPAPPPAALAVVEEAPAPSTPPARLPASGRRRFAWVMVGTGIALCVLAAGFLLIGKQTTDREPPANDTDAATEPATPAAPARSLQWMGAPAPTYAVGDYLQAWWIAASPEATAPPVFCRVTLLHLDSGFRLTRRIADEKFVFPLDRSGRFRLTVVPLEGQEGVAGSLEAEFQVTEAAPSEAR